MSKKVLIGIGIAIVVIVEGSQLMYSDLLRKPARRSRPSPLKLNQSRMMETLRQNPKWAQLQKMHRKLKKWINL